MVRQGSVNTEISAVWLNYNILLNLPVSHCGRMTSESTKGNTFSHLSYFYAIATPTIDIFYLFVSFFVKEGKRKAKGFFAREKSSCSSCLYIAQ